MLPILAVMGIIQAGASVGMGLYQYSANEKAREEARASADQLRTDTLKQNKISNRQTNQQLSNRRSQIRDQAEVNSLQTDAMAKQKSDTESDERLDILRTGRDKRASSAISNLESRLSKIGGE